MSSSTLTQNDQSVTLKMVQQHSQTELQANGFMSSTQPFIGAGADHAMTFDVRDVADWLIPELSFTDSKKTPNGMAAFHEDLTVLTKSRRLIRVPHRYGHFRKQRSGRTKASEMGSRCQCWT